MAPKQREDFRPSLVGNAVQVVRLHGHSQSSNNPGQSTDIHDSADPSNDHHDGRRTSTFPFFDAIPWLPRANGPSSSLDYMPMIVLYLVTPSKKKKSQSRPTLPGASEVNMDRTMGITVRPDPSTVPRFPQLTDNPTNNLIPPPST